jgi:hypothetical protein
VLDDGCCGLAGSFGFEAGEHYDVSMAAGESKLLPAVRDLPDSALVMTDGFSCATQIAQATNRQALHIAQVLQMALRDGPNGPAINPPEERYLMQPPASRVGPTVSAAGVTAAAVIGVAIVAWRAKSARFA